MEHIGKKVFMTVQYLLLVFCLMYVKTLGTEYLPALRDMEGGLNVAVIFFGIYGFHVIYKLNLKGIKLQDIDKGKLEMVIMLALFFISVLGGTIGEIFQRLIPQSLQESWGFPLLIAITILPWAYIAFHIVVKDYYRKGDAV